MPIGQLRVPSRQWCDTTDGMSRNIFADKSIVAIERNATLCFVTAASELCTD